jgi:hypothetical protein
MYSIDLFSSTVENDLMRYWIQICPVCDQGRLFVSNMVESRKLFLLCEECESAWSTPGEVDEKTGDFPFEGNQIVFADEESIREAGWTNIQLNETQ